MTVTKWTGKGHQLITEIIKSVLSRSRRKSWKENRRERLNKLLEKHENTNDSQVTRSVEDRSWRLQRMPQTAEVQQRQQIVIPDTESTWLPPLSDPAPLPSRSAGDVCSMEPTVAAMLLASSSLAGPDAVASDICPASRLPASAACWHSTETWTINRKKDANMSDFPLQNNKRAIMIVLHNKTIRISTMQRLCQLVRSFHHEIWYKLWSRPNR